MFSISNNIYCGDFIKPWLHLGVDPLDSPEIGLHF